MEKIKTFFLTLWRYFLVFLDLIGIYENKKVDQSRQLARFRLHHTQFRYLLTANNSFLETLADLEEKRFKQEYFDLAYVEGKMLRINVDIHQMITSINAISNNRYPALTKVNDDLLANISRIIERYKSIDEKELICDIPQVQNRQVGLWGGKIASLCEVRNEAGLPTPDGFVVSAEGFRLLIEKTGLEPIIRKELANLDADADILKISQTLAEQFQVISVPDELVNGIYQAYDRLAQRRGREPILVAVRSSALGEDSHLSFAGQFLTILNVDRAGLIKAFVRVAASLFSAEAIAYRRLHKIQQQYLPAMAVGFIEMIDARVSGVMFTKAPDRPESDRMLIHTVLGLGVSLVSGYVSPEIIEVQRSPEMKLAVRTPALQKIAFVSDPSSMIKKVEVPEEEASKDFITNDEAMRLSQWGLRLEAHFGSPQDIEWVMDEARDIYIVQSRPIRTVGKPEPVHIEGLPILLSGGDVAFPGIGIGPAYHLDEKGDIEVFPEGAILVAPRSSPRFVRLMDRAKGIIADVGSTTGHMASLAREFRIPTLLNMQTATQTIPQNEMITLDAANQRVYAGAAAGIDQDKITEHPDAPLTDWVRSTRPFRFLEELVGFIVPLNLTNPRSQRFRGENCKTFHDIARFVHEKAYTEMFHQGEHMGDLRGVSFYLDVFLPIDLYVIDLGGGVSSAAKSRKIKPAQIISTPLKALLNGILDKRIPRFGPKPMDMQGFFTIMMRHAIHNPEQERTFQDPCYAMVSDNYLNYTSRVGYHFGIVDAYCGKTVNKNYISILFRGGAADMTRRNRRIQVIAGILQTHGFLVETNKDTLTARLNKEPLEKITSCLEMIGRLLQFVRQMDVAMVSDESVEQVKNAFLTENYTLS